MITDYTTDDGTAQQQSVFTSEGTAARSGIFFDLISDDLGCASTKIDNLRPVKIISWPDSRARAELL